jgi:hypothetical protein
MMILAYTAAGAFCAGGFVTIVFRPEKTETVALLGAAVGALVIALDLAAR